MLELPDLGTDPRLADMHALRRAGEVRFLGHNQGSSKTLQIHDFNCGYVSLLRVVHRRAVPRVVTTCAVS